MVTQSGYRAETIKSLPLLQIIVVVYLSEKWIATHSMNCRIDFNEQQRCLLSHVNKRTQIHWIFGMMDWVRDILLYRWPSMGRSHSLALFDLVCAWADDEWNQSSTWWWHCLFACFAKVFVVCSIKCILWHSMMIWKVNRYLQFLVGRLWFTRALWLTINMCVHLCTQ